MSDRHMSISTVSEHHPNTTVRLGILSQTLAPSPHIRWILPARIRSSKYHDVIFVGDSCIQLREFLPNGQLADATSRLNMGAQIMAAKVISAKVKRISKTDPVSDREWDEDCFLIRDKPCEDDQPPQLVVLCTANSELIYVYAEITGSTNTRLVFAKRNILKGVSLPSRYGRHMAVDPESKLLAVASSNQCCVFSLKHVDELKESIDSWKPSKPTSFRPSKEQRFIPIDGAIVRMDFLRSPEQESHKVYLMFLVAKGGETRTILYRWDSRGPLINIEPVKCCGNEAIPDEDSFPLELFPAANPLSFWIVTESALVLYTNVTSSYFDRKDTILDSSESHQKKKLWVQWVKPSRHEPHLKAYEDILLMREDGAIRSFSRMYAPNPTNLVLQTLVGELKMRIDTAVCMLPGPQHMGGDILIAGGVGSDGGVFHLPPRELPQLLQTIPNVSPVHNMVVLNRTTASKDRADRPGRTFVISDGAAGENLNELRFGLEAQIGWTMDMENSSTIDRLWAVEQHETKKLYIIASHPEHTVAVEFDLQNHDNLASLEPETCLGIDFNVATVAAANTITGDIVLVTSKNVTLITDSIRQCTPRFTASLDECVCADIDVGSSTFVMVCTTSSGYDLRIGMFSTSEGKEGIQVAPAGVNVLSRPLSLRITQVGGFHVVAAGFFDGSIQILSARSDGQLEEQTHLSGSGTKGAGVSALAILSLPGSPLCLVVAGSRNGVLEILSLYPNPRSESAALTLKSLASYTLGSTAVLIVPEEQSESRPKSALITCGKRTGRLRLLCDGNPPDFVFDNIWVTNRGEPSYAPSAISAIHRIRTLTSNDGAEPSGLMMCVTEEDILFTSLLEQEQMVPRCLSQCAGARHFEYSRYLKKFVLATDGELATEGKLSKKPTISLVDPNNVTVTTESPVTVTIGEPGEKIKALINWSPSDGKRHYEMIMVALGDGYNSRVGHLSAKKLIDDHGESVSLKTVLKFTGKQVHALCTFGMSSVVISTGNQLMLLELDVANKKFRQQASYDLPSPTFSISSRGSYICAATTKHSIIVLRFQNQGFERVFAEKAARNARSVVPFGLDMRHVIVSTVSDAGTTISGYLDGVSDEKTRSPSFEAQVSLPIEKLVAVESSWGHDRHYSFQGNTSDGTIYLFKTLTYAEWKLLRFLQRLAPPDASEPVKKVSLLNKKMNEMWISSLKLQGNSTFDPKSMHIKGDVLQRFIEDGPHHLRWMVGDIVKMEDDMDADHGKTRSNAKKLEELAAPVIGETTDTVAAVIAWLRRLLRSTIS